MATLPYFRTKLMAKPESFAHVERWAAAMLARPAVRAGMKVDTGRAETVEGGLTGFSDEHRSILWGDRQHAPR